MLKLNSENPTLAITEPTFNAILERFIEEEKLLEIKQRRLDEPLNGEGELSYSTVVSYLSVIKQVRVKWGTTRITQMKPLKVQNWLKEMDAAPRTKGHVKAIMHRLYEKAMLWEMVDCQRNPMELVEIKGISKRKKKPIVLTVEQYYQIIELLPQPYRTMVVVAQCTGLRAEEVLALEWPDIDFESLSMKVVRAVVHGRVKTVKTEYVGGRASARSRLRFGSSGLEEGMRKEGRNRGINPAQWVGPALYQPGDGAPLPHGSDPAGLYPSGRMLPGGVPEVRRRGGSLVSDGQPDPERQTAPAP